MAQQKNGAHRKSVNDLWNNPDSQKISKLGQRLREISDKALASGTETLSLEQIQTLISEIRGRSA